MDCTAGDVEGVCLLRALMLGYHQGCYESSVLCFCCAAILPQVPSGHTAPLHVGVLSVCSQGSPGCTITPRQPRQHRTRLQAGLTSLSQALGVFLDYRRVQLTPFHYTDSRNTMSTFTNSGLLGFASFEGCLSLLVSVQPEAPAGSALLKKCC